MPITHVEIEGFMSFKHQVVTLTPGVTLVAGANRQGKTNVVRALRWVLLNDGPSYSDTNADDNLRHGHGDNKVPVARVRVVYDNGAWVERRRGRGENVYVLHHADGREEEFSGIGQGFYAPVAEITGFAPVSTGSKETVVLGWQGVTDPKLLVGESASVVDRQLTRMIGTNRLETAVSLAHSDVSDLRKQVKGTTAQVETLTTQLEALSGLDAAAALCERAQAIEEDAARLTTCCVVAGNVIDSIEPVDHRLQALNAGLPAANECVGRVGAALNAAIASETCLLEARVTIEQFEAVASRAEAGSRWLPAAEAAALTAGSLIEEAASADRVLAAANACVLEYEQGVVLAATVTERLEATEGDAAVAHQQLEAYLEENPACPHCGRLGTCPHCGEKTEVAI